MVEFGQYFTNFLKTLQWPVGRTVFRGLSFSVMAGIRTDNSGELVGLLRLCAGIPASAVQAEEFSVGGQLVGLLSVGGVRKTLECSTASGWRNSVHEDGVGCRGGEGAGISLKWLEFLGGVFTFFCESFRLPGGRNSFAWANVL